MLYILDHVHPKHLKSITWEGKRWLQLKMSELRSWVLCIKNNDCTKEWWNSSLSNWKENESSVLIRYGRSQKREGGFNCFQPELRLRSSEFELTPHYNQILYDRRQYYLIWGISAANLYCWCHVSINSWGKMLSKLLW